MSHYADYADRASGLVLAGERAQGCPIMNRATVPVDSYVNVQVHARRFAGTSRCLRNGMEQFEVGHRQIDTLAQGRLKVCAWGVEPAEDRGTNTGGA